MDNKNLFNKWESMGSYQSQQAKQMLGWITMDNWSNHPSACCL